MVKSSYKKSKRKAKKALLRLAKDHPTIEEISALQAHGPFYDWVDEGPRPAMVSARDHARWLTELLNAGADCFKLSQKQLDALHAITGQKRRWPERLLLSCTPLRLKLTSKFIKYWSDHWHEHHREPSRRYMFVTIITDNGNALARKSYVDLEALRRRAYKVLSQVNLDGVYAIEVQALTNFPSLGDGGTHLWHVHCIATTDEPNFDIPRAQKELRASGRLSNIFDAPTVSITPIVSLEQLKRNCNYMMKAPAVGKRLVPHPEIPHAWTFDKVFLRKDDALRLVEALSQVEFGQVVHAIGLGKHILRPAMQALRVWHKAKCAKARKRLLADLDIAALWAEIRRGRPKNLYQPYNFGDGNLKLAGKWLKVARRALLTINAKRAEKAARKRRSQGSSKSQSRMRL